MEVRCQRKIIKDNRDDDDDDVDVHDDPNATVMLFSQSYWRRLLLAANPRCRAKYR